MEEKLEKEDMIGRLIHEEGLMSPSPGFTDRVMMRIEESRQHAGSGYKPLISRTMWTIIVVVAIILLLVCYFGEASGNPGQSAYFVSIRSVTDFLTGIHIPIHVNSGTLILATLIMASTGILLYLDFLLNKRYHGIFK